MMKLIRILIFSCLSFIINNSYAQSALELEQLSDSIQSILKKEQIPGVFVTVVSKDSVLYKRGFGYADVALQKPTTSQHLFKIGSISKTFTALAIMKLIEQGKLSLDTKLAEIAPEVPFENEWEATHPVKIKHLLEHKTGFDDTHANIFATDRINDMTAFDEVMLMKASLKSRWQPGLWFAYSNTGCTILGYIIEKITNQRYQDYIKNEVLIPLNMNSSDFRSAFADKLSSDDFSVGYQLVDENVEKSRDIKLICEPAGSIMSSADDMSHLLQFFLNEKTTDNQYVVSPTTIATMEALHGDLEVENNITDGFGLGVYTKTYGTKNIRFHGHAGYIFGFTSVYIYNRALNLGIALSINTTGSSPKNLIKLLVDVFTSHVEKANQEDNIDGSKLPDWEGEYKLLTTRNQKFNIMDFPMKTVSINILEDRVELGRFLNEKKEIYVNQKDNSFTKRKHFVPSLQLIEKDDKKYIRYKYDIYEPVNKIGFLIFRILLIISIILGVIAMVTTLTQSIIALFKKSWRTKNLKNSFITTLHVLCLFLPILIVNYYYNSEKVEIMGQLNLVTFFVCLLTTLFPIATIWAMYSVIRDWNIITNTFFKIYYSLIVFSGIFLTVYFMYHGWFMKMLWI